MKKICLMILCLALLVGSLPLATVTYADGDDNTLGNLTVASLVYQDGAEKVISCGLYPAFSSEQTESVVDVAYGVEEVRIVAQPASVTATLRINGVQVAAGVAAVVYGRDLAVGDNLIPITVTSASGSQSTYDLHIKRVSFDFALAPLPRTPAAYQASDYARYRCCLAVGNNYSLALKKNGRVVAWGGNDKKQCNVPINLANVTALAAGNAHSLACKADGRVVAWGDNIKGQCNVPTGLSEVVAVSAGRYFSAALEEDGRVVVWGDNSKGQCTVPSGLNNVVDIQCGYEHMLALKADGTVVAWGGNNSGQCMVPAGLDHVVAVAAGFKSSIALRDDGTLVIWGTDSQGNEFKNLNLQFVKAIAVGAYHAAALKWDGSLAVWGNNTGQNVDLGVPLISDKRVLAVSGYGNNRHLLTLREDGTVAAWGDLTDLHYGNYNGQCNVPQGLNLLTDDPPPYSGPVPNIPQTPAAYAASDYVRAAAKVYDVAEYQVAVNMDGNLKLYYNSPITDEQFGISRVPASVKNVKSIGVMTLAIDIVALKEDGTVVVWGNNADGQCDVPEQANDVASIATGYYHCLALREDGMVVVWGRNNKGQCDVSAGLGGITAIAAGSYHNLALCEDGTVAAWGDNTNGQCDVPPGLTGVARIYAFGNTSFALKNDGTLVVWGYTSGQYDVPDGLNNVVDLSVGSACAALKADGTVVVWGDNSYGRRNVPVGLHDVASVTSGDDGIFAVKTDGSVVVWGYRSTIDVEKVSGLANVLKVLRGSTAIYRDGTLQYIGAGTAGDALQRNALLAGVNVLAGHYFVVNNVGLYDSSGKSINSVACQGGYRIQASIANNNSGSSKGLAILQVRGGPGATSSGGGRVLGCIGVEGEVPVDGQPVSADFTMPAGLSGPAFVDVFVWDGWDTMVPRAKPNQNLSFNITQ
ncbi:Alpha-tubulin suppressor and related RCC1 domain- containing protein-like protein [Desulfofarcimen acetoxidans DSM 771]|uniref:Alpha-tubulin suppressor and related RCC1 domain-containing protein-like protein n=1 Tax=Desulfofarcimen acetoxidans (strain ATCC 49208 / DSM 771 / KCTC 5769 / VKM B-1644 / 5575) TaxID=485916 RepID=C8W6V3_DESAS|nr:cadherin-like beta sandwich domain-containing protein [Desulfofarcimen acetoxidans]ACV64212.1 Alpha-tubulin suppressor and related RCC1 domain- containing protein-like protein [Desulfofarcimen acetoxidans DSM 771]